MAKLIDKLKEKGQEIAKASKEKYDALFHSSKEIEGDFLLIPCIAEQIIEEFKADGFEAEYTQTENHFEISLTNGGLAKMALGLKTALKVNIYPLNGNIHIDADAGVIGQQEPSLAGTAFEALPVTTTQTWSRLKQSKLDDKAVAIAEKVVSTDKIVSLLDGTRIPLSQVPDGMVFVDEDGQEILNEVEFTESPNKENKKISRTIGGMVKTATTKVSDALDDVKEKVNETTQKIAQNEKFQETVAKMSDTLDDVKEKATETVQKIAQNEKFQETVAKVSDVLDDVKEKATETAQKIAQNEQVQNVMAKTSQLMLNTKEKWNEAATAAKIKMAAVSQSVAESEAFRKAVDQYQRIRQNEKVVMAVDKFNEIIADERTQKILAATSKAAQKTGQFTKKGLKVISGVQAVQDRKRSLQTKEEADALKAEIEKTNEAIRDDLNDTLEDFSSYRVMALKNTVGLFLEYLERMNQKSKTKEYEFLKEIDIKQEELNDLKVIDMEASDVIKTVSTGVKYAAGGLKSVTGLVGFLGKAGTGTTIRSLHGAAAKKALLASFGRFAPAGWKVFAGTVVLGAGTVAVAWLTIGSLASSFYADKATKATQYLADVQQWAAKTEQSWIVLDGLKSRVLELQNVTEELEQRAIVELADLEPYVDSFDPNDKKQVKEFQEAAIMVKSMSELAQTPILDEDGNFNENAKIVMAKTEKIINKEL